MRVRDLIPWNRESNINVSKHDADASFYALQKEMNRMFDSFSRIFFDDMSITKDTGFSQAVVPRINVSETESEVEITAELPGMEEKDIEVNLSKDALVIKGEKKTEKEDKNKGYRLVERTYGSFHRAIPIPTGVESEKVEAKFKNGVLTVVLPKTKEAQKEIKKIAITAA